MSLFSFKDKTGQAIRKKSSKGAFLPFKRPSREVCKIFQNWDFVEHLPTAASGAVKAFSQKIYKKASVVRNLLNRFLLNRTPLQNNFGLLLLIRLTHRNSILNIDRVKKYLTGYNIWQLLLSFIIVTLDYYHYSFRKTLV